MKQFHFLLLGVAPFVWLLLFALPYVCRAADATPALTVREAGVILFSRQDAESEGIAKLQKGEELAPLAESVGIETWYMVTTKQGLIGWVRAADVVASSQLKETFKEQQVSTWSARTSSGRTLEGTWTYEPGSAPDKASGSWTLGDGKGKIVLRGTWTAQKFSTGWSGVWRAVVEGQKGEQAGSWTADFPHAREARFANLFEAATRDAIRGIWNAENNSGSWSIRAEK